MPKTKLTGCALKSVCLPEAGAPQPRGATSGEPRWAESCLTVRAQARGSLQFSDGSIRATGGKGDFSLQEKVENQERSTTLSPTVTACGKGTQELPTPLRLSSSPLGPPGLAGILIRAITMSYTPPPSPKPPPLPPLPHPSPSHAPHLSHTPPPLPFLSLEG